MYYVFRSSALYLSNHEAQYSSKNACQRRVSAAGTSLTGLHPLTETRAEAAKVGNRHVLHILVI